MKVLFLDIDGVLNHRMTKDRVCGFMGLDPDLIAVFNKIVDAMPDLKIVVSSTWRHMFMPGVYSNFEELIQLLNKRGLKGEIIGRTPDSWHDIRGREISEWLADHPEVTHYVILDDSPDAGSGHDAHYVRTFWHVYGPGEWEGWEINKDDPRGGILDRHVAEALKILGAGSEI